jgi:hypothetical protein
LIDEAPTLGGSGSRLVVQCTKDQSENLEGAMKAKQWPVPTPDNKECCCPEILTARESELMTTM